MDMGRAIMRAYPLACGAGTVVNTSVFKKLFPAQARREWVKVDGGEILVALNDHVGRAIRYAGDLDPKISWVIDRCLKPGDAALDIGANCGLTALRMAARVGPAGQVHAFEPNPRVLGALRETLERNAEAPISLHPVALGDEVGQLPLFSPAGNEGGASLARISPSRGENAGMVSVVTLSDFAESQEIDRCDFIKIDVEGFEHNALSGGLDFLKRHMPRAIVLEEFGKPAAERLPPSLSLLRELGYELYALPVRLFSIRLLPIERLTASDRAHDYVALSPDCAPAIRRAVGQGPSPWRRSRERSRPQS